MPPATHSGSGPPRGVLALLAALVLGSLAGCATDAAVGMVRAPGIAHPADPAGLVERLAAGNIDQPGSRAYNRWGEGYDAGLRASDRRFIVPRSP